MGKFTDSINKDIKATSVCHTDYDFFYTFLTTTPDKLIE